MVLADYITITHVPTKKDITPHLVQVNEINFIGTDEARSSSFTLWAKFGDFITQSNNNDAPIINPFDLLKIETNVDGNRHWGIFEVTELIPSGDGSGKTLTIQLKGREYQLQKRHFAKSYRYASAFDIVRDVCEFWNDNKGTAQPMIIGYDVSSVTIGNDTIKTNQAPKWTAHDFSFKQQPTCFEVLNVLADRLGSSRANQGAGRFYEVYFEDHPILDNVMIIKFFPSGIGPAAPVTVQSDTIKPITLRRGDIKNMEGNVIVAKGPQKIGSIPEGHVRYWSSKEWFDLHPAWIANQTYPQGVNVQHKGIHYKSTLETSQEPSLDPGSDWIEQKVADEIGKTVYSLWTYLKAVSIFKNSGSRPHSATSDSGFDRPGFLDCNGIVRDEKHYRNFCHMRTNTSLYDADYKYGKNADGAVRGTKLLIDPSLGAIAGAFAQNGGKDAAEKNFSKSLVIHNGGRHAGAEEYRNWKVLRNLKKGDTIAIKSEGRNFVFDGSIMINDTNQQRGNDCFHNYESISNDTGIGKSSKQKGNYHWIDLDGDGRPDTGETYGTNSAVKITYTYTILSGLGSLGFKPSNPSYYQIGCWLGIESPLPPNTKNGISEELGQIYGGDPAKREPATFDAEGFFGLTPKGNSGYNKPDAAEMSRPSDSVDFWCKFKWEEALTGLPIIGQAEFKWRCYVFDTADNVFYADFTVLDNDIWQQISLNLSEFKEHLARTPRRWGEIWTNIAPPELELRRIFEWRNLKYVLFQLQEVYDEHGRYYPEGSRFVTLPAPTHRLSFWLDDLHFANQLVATSGPSPTRALEPRFIQRQNITNIRQLEQDLAAEKEIHEFAFEGWELTQARANDIDFGESFYFPDPNLVQRNDDGKPNTIKLVAKGVHYSGIKSLRRRLVGVKILT